MKHLIESRQFEPEVIKKIFRIADSYSKNHVVRGKTLEGKIMASLFYEPSTRTRFSFESAMHRLGGSVITTDNAREFSSAAKGETLEDTIRVVNHYADVIVLRHFEKGASERAAEVSSIPVINAGDGAGQHPTQALLDLYTIKKELGRLENVKIVFVGDMKNGRTVRSLAYLLGKQKNIEISFVSPKQLKIGDDIKEYLKRHKIFYKEFERLDGSLKRADVVYQTRIQKERFNNIREYEKYKGIYVLTMTEVKKMKPKSIIMHPLPRVDEIASEVDRSPKAVYFKQAKYGVLVRMALLKFLLS